MRIYVYAIIDSNEKISESIGGLEGATIYNISYQDIGAVVSNLIEQIKEINKERILKHEEVVEKLTESFTVLPVKFLTTFNQEEEVLVMLKEYYNDFKENLNRLRNKVEFGIKVIWEASTIRNRIIDAYKKSNLGIAVMDGSSAKSFVKEKFQNYKVDKEFEEEANRCIALIDDFFSRFAAEKKLAKLKTDNLLLSAFYLIEKDRQQDFKEAFERSKRTPGDLKFLCSGPWPPYNFINLNKKPYCFKEPIKRQIWESESGTKIQLVRRQYKL
jgi:D-mannonate dehydratase